MGVIHCSCTSCFEIFFPSTGISVLFIHSCFFIFPESCCFFREPNENKPLSLVVKDFWVVSFDPCFYMEKQNTQTLLVLFRTKIYFPKCMAFMDFAGNVCISILVFRENTKLISEIVLQRESDIRQ